MIIESKVLGRRARPFEPWKLDAGLIAEAETLSLGDLLTRIVLWEVEAFESRRRERTLERVLSAAEIATGAERGRIDPGGRDPGEAPDPERAVDAALTAFADGLYLVFVDDRKVESLDERVTVHQGSRTLFVRLVPLAGR
jgi:hypothetical protein